MKLRWCLGVALAFCGCSLLVDASDIDAGCPDGYKDCGECVRVDDARYGCDDVLCDPCNIPNAEPTCVDGQCEIERCWFGFGQVEDGCELPVLGDPKNCGSPNNACADGWLCIFGECVEPDPG